MRSSGLWLRSLAFNIGWYVGSMLFALAGAPLLLAPLSDLLMLSVWACAPLKRHVSWRGTRLRLGAGTLLYREAARISPGGPG